VIEVPTLFGHHFLDQDAATLRTRMLTESTWDIDHNELLSKRLPSGEFFVHVPHILAQRNPCKIVHPVGRDVDALSLGILATNRVD
jgi:hypothetical protein